MSVQFSVASILKAVNGDGHSWLYVDYLGLQREETPNEVKVLLVFAPRDPNHRYQDRSIAFSEVISEMDNPPLKNLLFKIIDKMIATPPNQLPIGAWVGALKVLEDLIADEKIEREECTSLLQDICARLLPSIGDVYSLDENQLALAITGGRVNSLQEAINYLVQKFGFTEDKFLKVWSTLIMACFRSEQPLEAWFRLWEKLTLPSSQQVFPFDLGIFEELLIWQIEAICTRPSIPSSKNLTLRDPNSPYSFLRILSLVDEKWKKETFAPFVLHECARALGRGYMGTVYALLTLLAEELNLALNGRRELNPGPLLERIKPEALIQAQNSHRFGIAAALALDLGDENALELVKRANAMRLPIGFYYNNTIS